MVQPIDLTVGTYTLPHEETFTQHYETAAWYKEITCEPQIVPLHIAIDLDRRNTASPIMKGWSATVTGTVTGSDFTSLFCGNRRGSKIDELVGEIAEYYVSGDGNYLAQQLLWGKEVRVTTPGWQPRIVFSSYQWEKSPRHYHTGYYMEQIQPIKRHDYDSLLEEWRDLSDWHIRYMTEMVGEISGLSPFPGASAEDVILVLDTLTRQRVNASLETNGYIPPLLDFGRYQYNFLKQDWLFLGLWCDAILNEDWYQVKQNNLVQKIYQVRFQMFGKHPDFPKWHESLYNRTADFDLINDALAEVEKIKAQGGTPIGLYYWTRDTGSWTLRKPYEEEQ